MQVSSQLPRPVQQTPQRPAPQQPPQNDNPLEADNFTFDFVSASPTQPTELYELPG